MLESCLRALGCDFGAYRAGWFAQLYRSLEPTCAESAAHQPLLLRLLRSAVPTTVSFAVAQLRLSQGLGRLTTMGTWRNAPRRWWCRRSPRPSQLASIGSNPPSRPTGESLGTGSSTPGSAGSNIAADFIEEPRSTIRMPARTAYWVLFGPARRSLTKPRVPSLCSLFRVLAGLGRQPGKSQSCRRSHHWECLVPTDFTPLELGYELRQMAGTQFCPPSRSAHFVSHRARGWSEAILVEAKHGERDATNAGRFALHPEVPKNLS